MEKEKYWMVSHSADTTETGLPMNRDYIKTIWQGFPLQQGCEKEILEDFCFSQYGPRTEYVQGVCPTPNWTISESDEERFKEARPIRWGGYNTKTRRIVLGIGYRGKTVVISDDVA